MTDFASPPVPSTARPPAGWRLAGGLLLVGLGATFLLTTGLLNAGNWWSMFILLPGVGLLALAATASLTRNPALKVAGRVWAGSGAVTLTTGLIFLLGLEWSYGWTVLLMVCGGLMVLYALPPTPSDSLRHALSSALGWAGLTTALLGVTFFFDQVGVVNLEALFGAAHWWSAFILLPGLGALAQGLVLLLILRREGSGPFALIALGLILIAIALGEFLGLGARWGVPVALIVGGAALLLSALRSK